MVELIRFRGREGRINIPQEISTKYEHFGILLLEDSTGAKIRKIDETYRGNPEDINSEVLQQWIVGKGKMPVTWRTLVDVLRDVEFAALAAEIEEVKQAHSTMLEQKLSQFSSFYGQNQPVSTFTR